MIAPEHIMPAAEYARRRHLDVRTVRARILSGSIPGHCERVGQRRSWYVHADRVGTRTGERAVDELLDRAGV